MERTRFQHLLDAYGADFKRWPAEERGSAAIFASQHAGEAEAMIAHARALDAALEPVRDVAMTPDLAARILAQAPAPPAFDRRAVWALAACAVFGVALGYGGGLLAPPADADASYLALTLEAPLDLQGEEG